MNREAKIQDDIRDAIERVARKSKFDGIEKRTLVDRDYKRPCLGLSQIWYAWGG